MEQRTCDIITVIKKPLCGTLIECVILYMSNICGCPTKYYTERMVYSIIKEAVIDYIKTETIKGQLISRYFNIFDSVSNTMEVLNLGCNIELYSWLGALQSVQVRDSDENGRYYCINGFTEEMLLMSEKYI